MEEYTIQVLMSETGQGVGVDAAEEMPEIHSELAYLRSKVDDLSSLIEISIIINSTLNVDELVGLVMEKAQSVMKAEASSVLLLNPETNMLECEVALGEVGDKVKKIQLALGEGIAGWVAKHGKPEIIPDVSSDPRFAAKIDNTTGFQTKSILAAPLTVKDKIIGVAEVINRADGKAFNEDDLNLFCTFCRQVALAIENARMHQMSLEKQRLEQELENAKFIQQSFMPENFPDSNRSYAISARSLAAASVGGDFYDFYEFDDHSVSVAVGDVTGKGVPAALYMARLVSDLRLYTQIYRDPAEIVKELNNVLVDRSRRGMFVTFQYGNLNTLTGDFTFANAGHLPFIRIGKRRKAELLTGGKTIPLGIAPDLQLEATTVRLKRGDSLVLITDGIMEAKNKKGRAYSLKRTLRTINQGPRDADGIVEYLLADVHDFAAGAQQHDDLTILTLTWNED